MATSLQDDLIAAVATPPGQGGIGVIRLSGRGAADVARSICNQTLVPRHATYCKFSDGDEIIDEGIAIAFAQSASFTGEEVVELQGHGGPVVLQRLLDLVCQHGARLAVVFLGGNRAHSQRTRRRCSFSARILVFRRRKWLLARLREPGEPDQFRLRNPHQNPKFLSMGATLPCNDRRVVQRADDDYVYNVVEGVRFLSL